MLSAGGASDLSRVNAFGAQVVRGSVGGRLEAEFAPGRELYSQAHSEGVVTVEILMVVNDADQQTIEVHLRLTNRTGVVLEVDPAGVRMLYRGLELPAAEPTRFSIPTGISRLIDWSFALGEATNSGIHELRINLPPGDPLRLPIKVPGLF